MSKHTNNCKNYYYCCYLITDIKLFFKYFLLFPRKMVYSDIYFTVNRYNVNNIACVRRINKKNDIQSYFKLGNLT